jgi:hypothetical protein
MCGFSSQNVLKIQRVQNTKEVRVLPNESSHRNLKRNNGVWFRPAETIDHRTVINIQNIIYWNFGFQTGYSKFPGFSQTLHLTYINTGYLKVAHFGIYNDPTALIERYVHRDSSPGIATRYKIEGPVIESQRGRDFLHPSRPTLVPTQLPIK